MKSNYKRLGDFIELVDVRNKELKVKTLLGLSISKQFIPSVANTVGTNMKNYKIIKKNQFACSIMQVRRDRKMPVALLKDFDEAIISQAYPVFEITKIEELLPDYLMMWFTRSEFDRHAEFLAVGGVRGSLEWEDFLDMTLPVPSLEKQQEIVDDYNTVQDRIRINGELNTALEETAQALYKHWFVDFEFPISLCHTEPVEVRIEDDVNVENIDHSKGYKSSGGAMVYNEELDMEIPMGWEVVELKSICKTIFSGGTPKTAVEDYWGNEFYWLSSGETRETIIINSERMITQKGVDNSSTKLAKIGDSIIASAGQGKTRGQTSFCGVDSYINQSVICIRPLKEIYQNYIFLYLFSNYLELRNESDGQSIRGSLNKGNIEQILLPKAKSEIYESFQKLTKPIFDQMFDNRIVSNELEEMLTFLLSKMATVEEEKALKQPIV